MGGKEREGNVHAGHRQRQKTKYLEYGLENFTDWEALELLLYYAIPRQDTNVLAHRLMNQFGSYRAVLEADSRELMAVPGIKENTAVLLTLVRAMNRRYTSQCRSVGIQLINSDEAGEYLRQFFEWETVEKVVMLSLNGAQQVLGQHELTEGMPDQVQLPIRTLADFALRDKAVGVILAHNHLDHNALPSNADIISTRLLSQALQPLGIRLLDHIVIADTDFVSILESGGLDYTRGQK